MDASRSTDNPSERGIGFQAVGFAVVGCAGVAILQVFSESSSWAYESFETALVRLYWAFVVPLAALFDWGRRMFETRSEIRKAARKKARKKAVKKAVMEERRRILASWEELRKLSREEARERILEGDPRSGVSDR